MLKVKRLSDSAIIPTIGHPGEDLGYDLYSAEDNKLYSKDFQIYHTGVAVEFTLEAEPDLKWGFLVKERSSLGAKGVFVLGGVIDAGYRGEIMLMLGNMGEDVIDIHAGDKIANL